MTNHFTNGLTRPLSAQQKTTADCLWETKALNANKTRPAAFVIIMWHCSPYLQILHFFPPLLILKKQPILKLNIQPLEKFSIFFALSTSDENIATLVGICCYNRTKRFKIRIECHALHRSDYSIMSSVWLYWLSFKLNPNRSDSSISKSVYVYFSSSVLYN